MSNFNSTKWHGHFTFFSVAQPTDLFSKITNVMVTVNIVFKHLLIDVTVLIQHNSSLGFGDKHLLCF